jgi:beta-lactamase regulating signal transducer with metallopeptidase domain
LRVSGVFPAHGAFPSALESNKETTNMGMGVSILLIAVGAILAWAVHVSTTGFNLHTIGYILLIVGAIGALLSLIFWSSWGGVGGPAGRRREVVREDY